MVSLGTSWVMCLRLLRLVLLRRIHLFCGTIHFVCSDVVQAIAVLSCYLLSWYSQILDLLTDFAVQLLIGPVLSVLGPVQCVAPTCCRFFLSVGLEVWLWPHGGRVSPPS